MTATLCCRDRLRQQVVIVLAQPLAEELVRHGKIGRRVLDSIENDRCEPGFIDLLRHLLPECRLGRHPHLIHLFSFSITYKCSQGLSTGVDNSMDRRHSPDRARRIFIPSCGHPNTRPTIVNLLHSGPHVIPQHTLPYTPSHQHGLGSSIANSHASSPAHPQNSQDHHSYPTTLIFSF